MERSFYVPIYIKPNTFNEESIAIGMIYFSQGQLYFANSDKKTQWALQFASTQSVGSVKRYLKRVANEIRRVNQDHSLLQSIQEPYQEHFYEQLKMGKNNFIQWGELVPLSQQLEKWKFEKLAFKVIGDLTNEKPKANTQKIGFRKRVNQTINKKVFDIFEKNRVFYPEELEGIFTTHKVDLVLLETTIMAIQFVDFSVSIPTIEKNIIQFSRVSRSLKIYADQNNIPVKGFYVAYQTPRQQRQKSLLERIKNENNKRFDLIHMNEVHKVLK